MNKAKILVVVLMFGMFCSCKPKQTVGNTPTPNAGKQWMQNLVCEFPCWAQITPQKTRFDDVIPLLQQANVKISFADTGGVDFQMDNDEISGGVRRNLYDGSVDFIRLMIMKKQLNLGDMIQVTGEPTEIVLSYGGDLKECVVELLVPEKGTVLELSLENINKKGCQVDIGADSRIFAITLFGNNLEGPLPYSGNSALYRMKWKGYGKYP